MELSEKQKCSDFNYFLDTYIKPDIETNNYINLIKNNIRININKENDKAAQAMYVFVLHRFLFGSKGINIGILAKTLRKAIKYDLDIYSICKTLPDFLFDKKYHERQSKFLRNTREGSRLNFGGVMPDYSTPFLGFTHSINIVDFKNFTKKGIKETLFECLLHAYLQTEYYSSEDIKIFILDDIPENISVTFREVSYGVSDFYKVGYDE